jgi:subtilisin family serine protease
MREPRMNWYFQPRSDDGGARDGGARDGGGARDDGGAARHDDGPMSGLTIVPADLLRRHGGRVLFPENAATIPGGPTPQATVYRARTLLVPGDLLQDPAFIEAVNAALARVGMHLLPPDRVPGRTPGGTPGKEVGAALRRLPRPAVLTLAPRTQAIPVVIDAWVALQALRAAADERANPALEGSAVRRITLEHLLVSSAINASPIWHSGGVGAGPGDASGGSDPDGTSSYLFSSGDARAPVSISLEPPRRRPADTCESDFGRRPVVAVLDTGVRTHTWLDVEADPAGGYLTAADGFVAVDQALQDAIKVDSELAFDAGDRPRHLIKHPWDTPVTADPLLGELVDDLGHGTFIAGIVRQVAPDARVLAVRVTHSDGVIYEGDLICALSLLAERVAVAEEGDLAAMVDVVSLSLGYFSESAADIVYSSGLWQVIELLLGLGVTVVAAAGNYSTSRKFYPAAFTEAPVPAGQVPLISVGALNPNGSTALFSDGGRWITAWASGAAVVSTFPTDINGSRSPQIALPDGREALDPDDYSGGFAVWSGTSFSAPLLAAHIARSLLAGAADPGGDLRLDLPGAQAATDRALAALEHLGWQA